jgi:predicted alpha/beta superfamily hydrolase
MRAFWLAAIAAVGAVASFAASASAQTLKVVSEADLFPQGHHRFIVHSEKVGRDFAVTVTMPVAYAIYGQPATKVAAIYALDNGYDIAGPLAQMLSRTGIMAPAYVVSIGYIEGQPNMRATDYQWKDDWQGSGGAAFLQFLTNELRPFIEARYPLDPDRAVLFGHSYGGVFTTNALAVNPKSFHGYIIGSTSQISDELVERLEKAAPKANGVRVFIAAGGAEGPNVIDSRSGSKRRCRSRDRQ